MSFRLLFLYSDAFAERVANNLINFPTFCQVCSELCSKCRTVYPSFVGNIYGAIILPNNLPSYLEEPEKYYPSTLPEVDIIIAVALHHDLLASIFHAVKLSHAKAVIIPIENPQWVPVGLQRQIEEDLVTKGVEITFPKPFCNLRKTNQPIIDHFIDYFKIGFPKLKIEDENGIIRVAVVQRSAPCGATWYIAQKIRDVELIDLDAAISLGHHSYPCTASMIHDRELNDTILHKAGYIARDSIKKSIDN